jgi:hypothetical protein
MNKLIIFIFSFCFNHVVNAQGCPDIDKNKLATTMRVDSSLVKLMNMEIPECKNLSLFSGYAGFVLDEKNTYLNKGIRSEISIDFPFVEGETIEYRWSIMVPSKNSPGGDSKQWWVIAQWHDQPDPRLGQTWATFKAQSPPVAIYIERRNGKVGLGLQGMRGKKISWSSIPTDVWLDLNTSIHWSRGRFGYVNFSVKGHPELDAISTGPNMLNGYQHYFKAGQYRAPTANQRSVIYIKNIHFRKLQIVEQ